MIEGSVLKLPLDENHSLLDLLMMSQYWFRQWLGAVRQQAITWAIVDLVLCHYMVSLGHNDLNLITHSLNFIVWDMSPGSHLWGS